MMTMLLLLLLNSSNLHSPIGIKSWHDIVRCIRIGPRRRFSIALRFNFHGLQVENTRRLFLPRPILLFTERHSLSKDASRHHFRFRRNGLDASGQVAAVVVGASQITEVEQDGLAGIDKVGGRHIGHGLFLFWKFAVNRLAGVLGGTGNLSLV
jgi:hypothetical protein